MKKLFLLILLALIVVVGYKYLYPVFSLENRQSGQLSFERETEAQNFPPAGPLMAVSLDNHPDARPQFGLSLADMVFETVTEGGTTRMLALFRSRDALKIGPVRSARPYFIDWALGAGAVFAHSGGSREALEKLKILGGALKDVNEFYNEKYFWRDKTRTAPHNLFTSTALLAQLAEKKGWGLDEGKVDLSAAVRLERTKAEGSATTTEILVDFSYPLFAAAYDYDPQRSVYKRSLGGSPDVDALNDEQITAANVVVLYTTSSVIDEKLLTVDLETLGSGRAVVFTGGGVRQARWQKADVDSPLSLIDADGSAVSLSPGATWIEVIDQTGTVVWK